MNYIEVKFTIQPKEPGNDILIVQLNEYGFETFEETEDGLNAYIQGDLFKEDFHKSIPLLDNPDFKINFERHAHPSQNWNEVWEKSFEPILLDAKCCIRASFHPAKKEVLYDVVINPKMSFGTGHHQTTSLVIKKMLSMDLKNKTVLDAGCGTAVLAILASKMEASEIMAFDIDDWAIENAKENIEINKVKNVKIVKGDSSLLDKKLFNVILANINKNVLQADMPAYSVSLQKNGDLLLSGFFVHDADELIKTASLHQLRCVSKEEKDKWCMLHFKKD